MEEEIQNREIFDFSHYSLNLFNDFESRNNNTIFDGQSICVSPSSFRCESDKSFILNDSNNYAQEQSTITDQKALNEKKEQSILSKLSKSDEIEIRNKQINEIMNKQEATTPITKQESIDSLKNETRTLKNIEFEDKSKDVISKFKSINSELDSQFIDEQDKNVLKVVQLKRGKLKIKKKRKKASVGCSCTKTNCIRLKCVCFKELGYCKPSCVCINCLNNKKNDKLRNFVIERTKLISSKAFKNTLVIVKDDKGEDTKINANGCKCKTDCSKMYCECRKINGRCSYICKCTQCANNKLEMERSKILNVYRRHKRKKHRIFVDYEEQFDSEVQGIVRFQED